MKTQKKASPTSSPLPYFYAAGALAAGVFVWFQSRLGIPGGTTAVTPFKIEKYLGKWYEIARFDYRFEKRLQDVTAEYTLNADGSLMVFNRGRDSATGEWEGAVGKAKFIGNKNRGRLKVSFFGPFYAAYNIIALDDDYENVLVAGNDLDYLWLLSRHPEMPKEIKNQFLIKAAAIGYDISKLIWTVQQKQS